MTLDRIACRALHHLGRILLHLALTRRARGTEAGARALTAAGALCEVRPPLPFNRLTDSKGYIRINTTPPALCTSTSTPRTHGLPHSCTLPAGHTGPHTNGLTGLNHLRWWTTGDQP